VIRVKICGVTTVGDALAAAELGASAIGLVFWPSSPRCVDVATARSIVQALPPLVAAVGVFVNQEDARRIAERAGIHVMQLHGDEPASSYRECTLPVIKAVAVRDRAAIDAAQNVPPGATVLLDAHDPGKRGGTGQRIDWTIASEIASRRSVILSGGLNPANVADAIAVVRPAAIDVSSGVESAPRKKDHAKLRELFDAVRHSTFSIQHLP
jgi:phosphoribosylanthranilate isomerase